MSVITSWTATPNRMKIVWDYLGTLGRRGVKVEELQHLIVPRSLRSRQVDDDEQNSGTTIGDGVITEMLNLELVSRADDGTIRIASDATRGDEDVFLRLLERRLLHPAEATRYKQSAFPLALAWFLAQDPVTPLEWGENYSRRVQDDCGADTRSFELTNSAGCNQFVYWARYLGFAWRLQIGRRREVVIADPTSAFSRKLPKVMKNDVDTPIWEVTSEISKLLPVLEEGAARVDVESRLIADKRRPEGHLSWSTSLALERLERGGQIVLRRLADANAVNLQLASGLRAVSHITWRHEE